MLDLVAALEWVRDNIVQFGGDPDNVMIFGESGGGAKVSTLLAMPSAAGLFNKAAIESGPGIHSMTPEAAMENTHKLLAALNVDEDHVEQLQDLPAETLVDALLKVFHGAPRGYAPVVDERSLPRHPFDPDAPAVSANVPIIVGYNKDETTVLFPRPTDFSHTWESLKKRLTPMMPGMDVDKVIAGMRALRPDATPTELYWTITTERGMGAGSYLLASRKAAQGTAPVWVYRMEWETPIEGGRLHAPHALEIPLVFDTVAKSESYIGEGAPEAQKVADTMSEYWLSFARDGDPNGPDLPNWPAYDNTRKATMVFNVTSEVKDDPVGDVRAIVLGP
jgi:para-nitrobenzyl esterase